MPGVQKYDKYNICIVCDILHPKNVFMCSQCHKKIRTRARNSTIKLQFVEY